MAGLRAGLAAWRPQRPTSQRLSVRRLVAEAVKPGKKPMVEANAMDVDPPALAPGKKGKPAGAKAPAGKRKAAAAAAEAPGAALASQLRHLPVDVQTTRLPDAHRPAAQAPCQPT